MPDHLSPTSSPRPARTVVVLCGGDSPHPALVVPAADVVVAADSGAEQAAALGVGVHLVVGDLDSIGAETLADITAGGGRIERHPADKDATDLELAVEAALAERPDRLVVVGGHGGRLDHAMATIGVLAAAADRTDAVEAWLGPAQVRVTTGVVELEARVGEVVSLVPLLGAVAGVRTRGLRWALRDATLTAGTTRGISNEATAAAVRVAVTAGTLAVVRPHALDPSADRRPPVPDRPAVGVDP